MANASNIVLPGQPLPLPRGPAPLLGTGTYTRDGQARASLLGVPQYEGSVGFHVLNAVRFTQVTDGNMLVDYAHIACAS